MRSDRGTDLAEVKPQSTNTGASANYTDMVEQIRITADEINCLVYAFLMDSGFTHSAFTLRAEAQLDHSPLFHKHIVRGQLVELLCKALLYLEVEHHWKNNQCSSDATAKTVSIAHFPIAQELAAFQGNGASGLETASKSKDSPMTVDESLEKSAKPDAEDLHADSSSESYKPKHQDVESSLSRAMTPEIELRPKKSRIKEVRDRSSQMDDTLSGAMTTLQGHTAEVFVCAWNTKNHTLFASGSKDAVVHLWSLPDPSTAPLKTIQPSTSFRYFSKADSADLTCLEWSPDGQLLAISSYDAILRICNANGELYFAHHQHNGPIFASRFSKSGQWLLTASLDGTACLWNVAEKRLHRQFQCHTDCCLDVDWLDDWTFASCGADNLIFIMQVNEEGSIKTLSGHENEINEIRFNPAGTRLASCSDDMTARIWNIESISNASDAIPGLMSSDPVVILRGHNHSVNIIAWSPDHPRGTNHHVATSSFDGTARIWDSVTGDCLKVFADHRQPLFAMTYSPSGKWLASGGADGWMHIYHLQSRTKRWSWYTGQEKPGIFEIDWQECDGISRFAVALESRKVVVFDALAIPALRG